MLLLGPVTCMHCTGLEVASTIISILVEMNVMIKEGILGETIVGRWMAFSLASTCSENAAYSASVILMNRLPESNWIWHWLAAMEKLQASQGL